VVVNFVTADEGTRATAGAVAELRKARAPEGPVTAVNGGFSTLYKDSTADRHLSYHHVTLSGLEERTGYEYRVKTKAGSAPASEWSDWLAFRSLYSTGVTRLAIYADMGVFASQFAQPAVPATSRHCMGNLMDDLASQKVDFAVHSGDHAYEFEVNGGARGDGYMDSYSEFLAHAPWVPGHGNHEASSLLFPIPPPPHPHSHPLRFSSLVNPPLSCLFRRVCNVVLVVVVVVCGFTTTPVVSRGGQGQSARQHYCGPHPRKEHGGSDHHPDVLLG
jgi:hypothetical protein